MSRTSGMIALVVITVVWGSTFVIIKDALDTIPASLLLALRFTLAALALCWVKIDRRAIRPAIWLGLLGFAGFATQTVGLELTSASNAAFITGLSVVLTPVVARVFWKRFMPRRAYLAAGVGFVGLAIMTVRDGFSGVNGGDLLVVLTAISYAIFIVYLGEVAQDLDTNSLAFLQHLPMALLAWIWALPVVGQIGEVQLKTWIYIAYLALVATALVAVLQVRAQKVVAAQVAALIFALEPVFAAAFAYFLLGERLGVQGLIGAAVLLAAIMISELRPRRRTIHST